MTSNSEEEGFEAAGSIDPELIPYLLAAEEDDEEELAEEDTEEGEDDELEALRAVVRDTLLAGADPELIASILGDGPEPQEEDEDPEAEHKALLDEAEAEAELNVVYKELAARTTEHQFDPSLERVQEVLYILGDPQDLYPIIHVAGTNGKTSTTRLASALLSGFGLRSGTFTSPHLQSVRERIQVNGQPLSAKEFLAAWRDVEPYIQMVDDKAKEAGGPQVSYFEALTITALAAFADIPVDVAVVEVGMGGRWDATNVAPAGVQVITPISIDHQDYLGETLGEIAAEKAEIIKAGGIAVVSAQEPEALEVIQKRAAEVDALMRLEGVDWSVESRQSGVGGQLISVRTPAALYEDLFVPLHGAHQAQNAAAALVAVEAMMGGRALQAEIVEQGFMQARSPGRLEIVRRSPTVIVDAAHNPAGVAVMREGLQEAFQTDYLVGVFSAMEDKAIEAMLVEIEPAMERIVVTSMPTPRAMDLDELVEIAQDVFGEDRVSRAENLVDALDEATKLMDEPTDPSLQRAVVVFGSIVLAGETKTLFDK
mgnify:FL=1